MKPKEIENFIKSYDLLRIKLEKEYQRDMRSGHGVPWDSVVNGKTLLFMHNWAEDKWEKWAQTERWKIYETLQESDFPECLPHLRQMLKQQYLDYWRFRACADKDTCAFVRRLIERIDVLMAEKPSWSKMLGTTINNYDAEQFTVTISVQMDDGSITTQYYRHFWEKGWRNPDPKQNSESAGKFFKSQTAKDLVIEADLKQKQSIRNNAKLEIKDGIQKALNHFEREELHILVDEVITELVMNA